MDLNDKIILPLPPLSNPENVATFNNAAIVLFLVNGKKIEGKLTRFDTGNAIIGLNHKEGGELHEVNMVDIKTMQLTQPIPFTPDPAISGGNKKSITSSTEPQEFTITFKDNSKLSGKTYGSRVDQQGIHLFKQHNTNQYLPQYLHLFIPKSAIHSNIIGEPIGEILIKNQGVVREEIANALEIQHNARTKPLGEYLISHTIVDTSQLEKALKQQKAMPSLKLGEILISENLIDELQLEDALMIQKKERRKPLGEILIDNGIVSREQIQQALAKKLGIPFVNLQEFKVSPDIIHKIPANLAFKHKVIPLYQYEGKLAVAIENPMDWEALDALRFHTNKYIEPVIGITEDINWALQFYYSSEDILNAIEPEGDEPDDSSFNSGKFESDGFTSHEESEVTDNIVVKIINKIIMDAYQQGVSDIHIEPNPGNKKVVVRFRKDGTMAVYHQFPPQYRNALISRIKVMSRLDISERRKPQDGKINFKQYGPANIELRIAILPTAGGLEDVVMRILSSGKNIPINALGLSSNNAEKLLAAIAQPYGLFLVCGPTGSGKTTTLHSVLGHLNNADRKIWTAEDPIEITQSGLRQVQVNPKIGLDFATAMRAFLRADPDIIMVGEMRDAETAGVGIEASLTGHLVLSTLHTNSAAESVTRLLDMGMDPFNFADALVGILAQRLAKTLCPSCKRPYHSNVREIHQLAHEYCAGLIPDNATAEETKAVIDQQLEQWVRRFGKNGKLTLYKAPGCKECNDTGYHGRIGLHELLIATPHIKQMILEHAPAYKIQKAALNDGMRTLKQDGIEKILQGYTDLTQIRTVCIK